MGKVFRENKSKLIPFVVITVMLFYPLYASASGRELELFDRGYENYICYQPENAVKEFRTFLEEFPRSSAKDAVMFWLGKSLEHLGSLEEARQVFSEMITEFPESPFREYAEKELEVISTTSEDDGLDSLDRSSESEAGTSEEKPERAEDSVKELSQDPSTIAEEGDELRSLFEEEEMKTGTLQAKMEKFDNKETYIATSSFVLSKLEVKDIAWRTEDILKDIENEQLLYERAKSLNISADPLTHQELVDRYHFNLEQAEYLRRFLSICRLVDLKLRDSEDERAVESLVVTYEEGDRYKKITLSTDLQKQAKSGVSFEDISRIHSDIVEFRVERFRDLEDRIKEKIYYLQNDEICVIWSEDGYRLLKPVARKISYNPFELMRPEMKDRIKTSVEELLQDIKEQR